MIVGREVLKQDHGESMNIDTRVQSEWEELKRIDRRTRPLFVSRHVSWTAGGRADGRARGRAGDRARGQAGGWASGQVRGPAYTGAINRDRAGSSVTDVQLADCLAIRA